MENKIGRPLLFKNVEELEGRMAEYWDYCKLSKKPLTLGGLSYYLNIDRKTLLNYSKKEAFFPLIKDARERVLMDMEERLQTSGQPTAGVIFAIKNSNERWHGWTDKQEIIAEAVNTNKNFDVSKMSTEAIKALLNE
jgi:hypothetical protein